MKILVIALLFTFCVHCFAVVLPEVESQSNSKRQPASKTRTPKIGDSIRATKSITFLKKDYSRVYNFMDWFQDKHYINDGQVFEVTKAKIYKQTKHIKEGNKYIRYRYVDITMKSDDCGIKPLDHALEQDSTKGYLKLYVTDEGCTITYEDTQLEGILDPMREALSSSFKVDSARILKRSGFLDLFEFIN